MKRLTALSATLCMFAFPAVLGATVVINSSMFGVGLGNTMKQVRHKLGRPYQVDRRGGTTSWYYFSRGLYVDFKQNRVHDLSTQSPSQRTARGVGVGSSELAVTRFVPGVRCTPGPPGPQGTDCTVASGHISTDFHIASWSGLVQYVIIEQRP